MKNWTLDNVIMALSSPYYLSLRFVLLIIVNGNLYATEDIPGLYYFETVDDVHIDSRVKRSLNGSEEIVKYVDFQAFNRSYLIILKPGTDVLAEGFEAEVINAGGSATFIHIDVNRFFSGHLVDVPDVLVSGHMEDNMISLTIYDHEETFTLEPAKIYKRRENWNLPDNTWIMYKFSDTELHGPKDYFNFNSGAHFCGSNSNNMNNHSDDVEDSEMPETDENNTKGKRSQSGNTCLILVVSTYDLFVKRCFGSYYTCASLMVSSVVFADNVYQHTDLGPFTGIRLQIQKMVIYDTATSKKRMKRNYIHFNADLNVWDYDKLLKSFTRLVKRPHQRSCVIFLFCAHIIQDNVLGLAHVGAICAWPSTGFSTAVTADGVSLTTARSNVLFTHGHLFGSTHDPKTPECCPPNNMGGSYVMWPFILSGQCINCKKYSPCSRRLIISTLRRKHLCFENYNPQKSMCGNGRIEAKEECDEGMQTIKPNACCTNQCRLVFHANCSDHNHECCHKCLLSPKGRVCKSRIPGLCMQSSFCSGKSLECPTPLPLKNGRKCRDNGECWDGECKDFCHVRGKKTGTKLKSCLCDSDQKAACQMCCYDVYDRRTGKAGLCVPRSATVMSDFRPCFMGTCLDGVCIPTTLKNRGIMDWISGMDMSAAVKFMQANVVMFVVILSLMIWIPVSIFISCLDKAIKEKQEWENRKDLRIMDMETNDHDYMNKGGRNFSFSTQSNDFSEEYESELAGDLVKVDDEDEGLSVGETAEESSEPSPVVQSKSKRTSQV